MREPGRQLEAEIVNFAGVLCAAAMLSTAGLVLSEKLDVLQLTFYTAPVSFAMLLPFYITREV